LSKKGGFSINTATISGYITKECDYINNEYRFFVGVDNQDKSVSEIPVIAREPLASKCYADFDEGTYVELVGELVRQEGKKMYLRALWIDYSKGRERKTLEMSVDEFMQVFKPNNIISNMKRLEKSNLNKEQRKKLREINK